MSKPIDPRLVRAAGSLRRYLAALVAKQLADGLLILAQAGLLASVLAAVFAGHHRLADLAPRLLLLLGVGAGRALLAAAQEYLGARASTGVRAQLRRAALRSIVSLGPGWAARQPVGRLAAATGPGLDSLDGYLVRAVPALVSAAVIPALVLIRITVADWQSGLLLALTLPLVPLFMALVGVTTKRRVQRQYALLSRLSGQFLDLLRGLTTLTVYGQAGRQQRTLRAATERYRRETMSALRVAFLSALVLDLVATLSVAVVAVDVGLRLDAASLPFGTALVVLLLAPELFAPLRAVGAQYHANVEGATAAAGALDLIEVAGPAGPVAGSAPVAADGRVRLDGVTVRFPERERPALHGLSCAVDAGELVVLTGRSGAGKSTLLAALLGFVTPVEGTLSVGSAGTLTPLPSLDLQSWRAELAWLPQRPVPSRPTVAEEVALGDPLAGEDAVAEVCRLCRTPSPDTLLAEDGAAVSAGQRRRIALARVLLRARAVQARGATPLVLLDEPSEDLDRVTEQVVAQVISGLAGQATVIVATHSEVLAALADRRLVLQDGALVSDTRQQRPAPGTPAIAEPAAAALTGTATASVSPVAARLGWRDVLAEPRIRRRLAGAAALAALAGLAGLGLTATSIWLIGRAAEHPNVQALAIAVVGVRTFAIARSLLRYLERLSGHDVALLMLVGLRGRVFAALAPLGPAVLGGYRRGDLLRRFVGDVDGLQDGVVRTLVPAAGAIATCVAACLLAAGLSPVAGLVLAATLVAAGVLTPWLAARAAGDADRLGELAGRRDAQSAAVVDGLGELVAYGAAEPSLAEIAALDERLAARSRRPAAVAGLGSAAGGLAAAVAMPLVLLAGAAAVGAGRLPAIDLGVLAICVLIGFESVAPLPAAFVAWRQSRAGLDRVADVLATPPAFTEPARPAAVVDPAIGVLAEELTLRPAADAPAVLTGAWLTVPAGSRVAVMGPSGSGKSTLLAAALRLAPAEAGCISVTEPGRSTPLTDLAAADLPPLLAGSLQGDHVFDATLRDNLRVVRPEADDGELDEVARRCGLSGFLAALPLGWSTPAGPDGSLLSGGQRQRLLLARAILADPRLLVLDEPTAHLDTETAAEVLADLLDATAGRTVLLSTHRELPGRQVDEVLLLDGGRLVTREPLPALAG